MSWVGFAISAVVLVALASVAHPMIGVITLISLSVGVWFVRSHLTGLQRTAQGQAPPLFAMGSLMDEAWQILHHTQHIQNPCAEIAQVGSGMVNANGSCCLLGLARKKESRGEMAVP